MHGIKRISLHFERENNPTVRFVTAHTAKSPPKMAVILKDTFILYPVSEQECPVLVARFSTGPSEPARTFRSIKRLDGTLRKNEKIRQNVSYIYLF